MNQAGQPAEAPSPTLPSAKSGAAGSGPAVGLDIESAENLPPAENPWSEPFYTDNFTAAEIEWSLRQPDARLAFCDLWSAKEAAIKCCPELAALRRLTIEVRHDALGRPTLRASRATQRHIARECLLSISHSGGTSMALCVRNRSQ